MSDQSALGRTRCRRCLVARWLDTDSWTPNPLVALTFILTLTLTLRPSFAGDHGSTFAGNPLVCHTACAVFDIVNNANFLADVTRKGEMLKQAIQDATAGNPHVTEVRGSGLLVGVQLDQTAGKVVEAARDAGLLIITAGAGEDAVASARRFGSSQHRCGIRKQHVSAGSRRHLLLMAPLTAMYPPCSCCLSVQKQGLKLRDACFQHSAMSCFVQQQ